MTRTAGRLLTVYLVGLVGLVILATATGFVGTAPAAADNTAPAPETQRIAPHGNTDLLDPTSTRKPTSSYPALTWEDMPASTVDSVESSDRTVPGDGDGINTVAENESRTDDETATTGAELAFVDATVDDHEALVRAVRADGIPVVNVTSAADVRSALTNRSDLAAIHVFSHGSVGEVLIGDDRLTTDTLDQYSGLTGALNSSLTADGEVLLYGCRVAENGVGRAFVDSVRTATGGDVAASDDLTGSADRDGDWHLEVSSGTVSTAELSATGFSGVLSVPEDEDYRENYPDFDTSRPSGSPFTLDGVEYVVTGSNGPYSHRVWIPPPAYAAMEFDDEGNGGVSRIDISAANGNNFQLKSIRLYPYDPVTLESSSGGSIAVPDERTTLDLSNNPDFQDINSFSITGSDMNPELINMDFEPPVRPPTFDDGDPTLTVDEDAGSISIDSLLSATDGNNGQTLTWTVVSNPSSGTLGGFPTDETSDGGSITPSGLTYTPDNDYSGTDSFQVRVKDNKGYANTVTVDVTVQDAPDIKSIERASPTSQDTNAASVDFDVTFSESVSGVDIGDFAITQVSGTVTGSISSVGSSSGKTITVTVGSINGDGDLRLDVSDDDSIKDTTNNVALGGEGTGGSADGSFTSGETYAIDNTPPSLSNFVLENDNSPGSSVGDGDTIRVAVFVSETANNVANVEADLSAFGAPSDVTLDDNNGDGNYDTTVTVDKATANEDGSYSVTIATSDDIGNQNTGSTPPLELNTNEAPTLDTNAGVTVDEGSTANQITNTELAASDPEQSAGSITYDVTTAPSDGTLFVDGGSGGTDDGTRDGESAIGTGTFTQADIDAGNLLYSHDGSEASTDAFDFDLKDGQGGTTAGNTFSIALDGVNDPPTLSLSTSDPTFTEDESSVGVFSSANVGVVEGSQQVNSLELTVSNVADGSAEQLTVDGSSVALTDTTTVTTANNDLSASVSVSGSTATVIINGGVSESTANTIINNLAYEHTGDDPSTAGDRTVTLTKLVDDGGTSNGGVDTTTFSKSGSVSITSVNDAPLQPSDSDGANNEVPEGASKGDSVGVAASSTDVDDDDSSLTYTLTDDASGRFQIDSPTGEVIVADASKLDHESSTSHTITVEASDGSLSSPIKDFTISITDSDETPSFAGVGSQTVAESSGGGTNVVDIDANVNANGNSPVDTGVSYALTAGNDDVASDGGGAFAIDNSGQITINDVDDIDESRQASFTVTIEASEDSQSATQDVTITVNDDVAPSFQSGSSDPADDGTDHIPSEDLALEFDESVTLGSGNIRIVDDDDGSSTQTLDVATDVTVSGSTVTVSPRSNLQADTNYHIEVDGTAIDDNYGNNYAGFSDRTTYNFKTADTDPSFTQGSSTDLTIDEDGSADLTSALGVRDTSSSDTLTWSVDSAPSNGALTGIDGETLDISGTASPHTLDTSPTYRPDADFNSMDSFDVTIADTLPGLSTDTITVDVTVEAVNDAPSFAASKSLPSIDEDPSNNGGSRIDSNELFSGEFSDPDGDSLAGIVATNDAATASEGTWQYSTDGGLTWYDVDDGSLSDSAGLLLSATTDLRFDPATDYNGNPGVLTVYAVDDSGSTTFTSGATRRTYDTTSDDSTAVAATSSNTVSVTVDSVNDAPSITIGSDQTTNADTAEQTVTDFATGFDPGGGESQSISDFIVTNDDNALFDTQPDITDENNDDKGDLTYTPADGVEGTATVDVQVVDDGGTSNGGEDTSATETFDITIDTSAPTFSSGANPPVAEDTTSVIDVNADGGSGTDTGVTYSLVGGADQSAFSIDSNTGALSFSSAPDFENPTDADTNNDYVVDVQADDGVVNTNTQTVTVDVTDVDEVPTAPDDSSQSTDEDSTISVADGDSADLLELASDPDAGDTLSFDTIDGSSFSGGTPVTLGSGATVTVDSDGSWTYDPNGQYESFDSGDSTTDTFAYTVADSDDDTAQGTVTVSITGVNDAPTAISLTSTTVAQSGGTDAAVGRLSATDPDDSSYTFSLVGGSGDGDNAEFNIDSGDLRADDARALAAGDYGVRLEADDGSGGTYQKAVTVSVTDGIAPTIASSTPADDATGVSEGDDIMITFSEDIAFGSGSVTLREDDGGFSDREAFDVRSDTGSGDGTVSISGRTLTITPTSNFASDTEYAVRIDPGALTDTASSLNDFGGISDDTALSFTTTDSALPTASAGPDTIINEGQSVSFDGTGSMDNVGIVSYDWDFDDDGTTATGQTTSHTFDSPGTYTVELTVTDAAGNTDTDAVEVTVKSTGSDGGGSGGSSGSTDTGGDQSTADDSSVGTETVVSGTRSDDGSISFTIDGSDDDGPITLDLSEIAADGTDDEDESGGNDDSEGEDENTVSVESLSITPTGSGSREFDISVRVWDTNIDTSERATESDDTGTDTTDVSDPQGATDGDRAHTDPRTFLIETSLSPLGYVEVTHTNPDTDIESVTFRFRIRKDALNQSDVDPSGVALYRNGTDGWTRLPTDEVGENSTHYVFEGTSPGLSLFTIASAQPAFEVMRASSRSETLTASEAVTVNVTVRNLGGAAGTYTAELRANGTVVATSDVDLAPNSSRTVSLSFTPSDPGEYTLTVGTVSAGAVSVQSDETPAESTSADQTLTEPTPAEQETTQQATVATDNSSQTASANGTRETTTDASGPGFGVLVLIGAFLIVIVFFRRRS